MNSLFPNELDEYNNHRLQAQSDIRLCYLIVLIMLSGSIHWFTYLENEEEKIDYLAVAKACEENFFVYEFDSLVEIFPNAGTFFERDKFLEE